LRKGRVKYDNNRGWITLPEETSYIPGKIIEHLDIEQSEYVSFNDEEGGFGTEF